MKQLLLALVIGGVTAAATGQSASLRLQLRGPAGEVVRPSRAQLVVVAWGDTERLDLVLESDSAIIDLGPTWLKSRWQRFDDMISVSVYLEAAGYAPVLSAPFGWPGSAHPDAPRGAIVFPHNSAVPIGDSHPATAIVRLRRPAPRQLTFVDEDQAPVAGLRVSTGMFLSRSNHCGVFDGATLVEQRTNDRGAVTVGDGDFPLAVALGTSDFRFASSDKGPAVIAAGVANQTVLLHRLRRSTLSLTVTAADGSAVSGLRLVADGTFCGCGYCGRALGTSNGAGVIQVERFSPEEWDDAWLCRGTTEVWHTPVHPPDLGAGPIRLDANYKRDTNHFGDVCANPTRARPSPSPTR